MTAEEKYAVRQQIKALRRQLTKAEKEESSQAACRLLLPLLSDVPVVFCYADLPSEMGTDVLLKELWARGTATALPRVEGNEIFFYLVRSFSDLKTGAMGIREPGPDCPVLFRPSAPVVTPGLAFDRHGGRIGYGGGYYDRFFSREPEHPAFGLCFSFQMTEEALPLEGHDHFMNTVITEQSVWICS